MYLKIFSAISVFHNSQVCLYLQEVFDQGFPQGQPGRTKQGNRLYQRVVAATSSRRGQNKNFSTSLRRWLVLMFSTIWLFSCGTVSLLLEDSGPRTHLIHVASNGWHTAIIVPAPALVAIGVLPEAMDFPDAAFLEFGWGDRSYYPAKEKTLGMTLSAALVPTPAVMHIAARPVPPKDNAVGNEVISVGLTEEGFKALVQALAAEFERPSGGRAESVSHGLYLDSRFYNAHGKFHLFNTCNTWTARMLRAGGVALSPFGIMTAGELMAHLQVALTKMN